MITIKILNMTCTMCAAALKQSFEKKQTSIAIDITKHTLVVLENPHGYYLEDIIQIVENTGYKVDMSDLATYQKVEVSQLSDELKRALNKNDYLFDREGFVYLDKQALANFKEKLPKNYREKLHKDDKGELEDKATSKHNKMHLSKLRLIVSIIIFIVSELPMLMYVGIDLPFFTFLHNGYIQAFLSTIIVIFVGPEFFIGAWNGLKNRVLNMDVLVTIGSLIAYFFSWYQLVYYGTHQHDIHFYFEAASAIISLIYIGHYLEHRTSDKVANTLNEFMNIGAKIAHVVVDEKNNVVETMPIDDVQVGMLIEIRKGEKVPLDGIVERGKSYVDESMITGEPVPVYKEKGKDIIGSTINTSDILYVRVRKTNDNGVLADIIHSIEKAQLDRPNIQLLADKISTFFVPTILVIAFITFIVWYFIGQPFVFIPAFEAAVSVIVISCPCALGLATPLSTLIGSSRAAKRGILYKSGKVFEKIKKVDAICFDKTGTLTYGRPEVVATSQSVSIDVATRIVQLEKKSLHPFAYALTTKMMEMFSHEIKKETAMKIEEVPGKGIFGVENQQRYYVGSIAWIQTLGAKLTESDQKFYETHAQLGHSILGYFDGQNLILFVIADQIKEHALEVIQTLKKQGIEVMMITGDATASATSIAKQLGITQFYAEVLPSQKAEYVTKIQAKGKQVAFVGDGINDAPALATADLGIALGSGAQIVLGAADVTLVNADLRGILTALKISKMTLRNIYENFAWAFSYNVIAIPMAAFGLLTPVFAAAFMAFSDIVVVLNASRLKIQKIDRIKKTNKQ